MLQIAWGLAKHLILFSLVLVLLVTYSIFDVWDFSGEKKH